MPIQKKYTLVVQWFDPASSLIRQFNLIYFLPENHIEMYDLKNKKTFLKKIYYPDLTKDQLYLGNVLICYNRQLKVIAFADQFTNQELTGGKNVDNKTYAMLKPNAYLNFGKILTQIQKSQFSISNLKMFQFRREDAEIFYGEHQGKQFYNNLISFITEDYCLGLELISNDAINKWRKVIGPTNSIKAKTDAPNSIRAKFGEDGTRNACHGSDSILSATKELEFVFSSNSPLKSRPYYQNCSLCIIKPHIVKSKRLGEVVESILSNGFEISAMQMIWFDVTTANEFYESYKFLPQSKRMIDQLASGPAVVLEVRQENAVQSFRELCGPYDPEIARKLQNKSIRALYGVDRVQNAVHCTDLPEDGKLEVQFIFATMLA